MKYYIVDAFTDKVFSGNQAGVCLLDEQISDEMMQNIASENNLSETAFLIKKDDEYCLRWFTPDVEIDLCGHATLATACVMMTQVAPDMKSISFHTQCIFLPGHQIQWRFLLCLKRHWGVKCWKLHCPEIW